MTHTIDSLFHPTTLVASAAVYVVEVYYWGAFLLEPRVDFIQKN